jgi:TolB-like protein
MLKTGPSSSGEREALSPEQQALVRQHLEGVLHSPAFAGSKRTQDFLRLVVDHTLDGQLDHLKERMIGAELFGRPISYDTGSDSVVRVRANEARKKLALYYGDHHDGHLAVRIELPSGSYVPRFHFETPAPVPTPEIHVSAEAHPPGPPAASHTPAEPLIPPVRKVRRRVWWMTAACIIAIAAIGVYAYLLKVHNDSIAHRSIHSIAILPLENLSGVTAQDYFADGLTEELINDLGQVSTLRVISLTSSMSYKGSKKKLPDIARELSVDAVVEGGVLREGDQVRISAQLIDPRSDQPIWAHTYNRNLTNVLSWQGEVAQAIAEEITTKVTPQEQARLARKTEVDPQAQDLYLQGILLREKADCAQAIQLFQRAIAIQPGYAQAHSALASCYGMLGESGSMPYLKAFTSQKAEAAKAIELDDSLSEAHAELANTAMTLDWDWSKAEAEFHRAIELNPNSATSHEKYAFFLVRTGHPQQALEEIERSVDLDPVSGSTFHSQGFIYYFARQYDRAYDVTQQVRNLRINVPDWTFLLGEIYAEQSKYADAIAAFQKAGSGPYTLGHLGNAYARAGKAEAARDAIAKLQRIVQQDGVGRYEIALVYAGLGQKTEAFDWLEQAYRAHDVGLVYLKVDPCLGPLRSDPRFEGLIRRVGLAP